MPLFRSVLDSSGYRYNILSAIAESSHCSDSNLKAGRRVVAFISPGNDHMLDKYVASKNSKCSSWT